MSRAKTYTREFQLGACKLVVEQGYSRNEAAKRLNVSSESIRRWIAKFRASGDLPPAGQPVPEAVQMREMRKELERLRMENEILKKAAAYFAKESL